MEKSWHSVSWEEVVKVLKSDSQKGLSGKEVEARQEQFGKNKLPEEKPLTKLRIFLEQFKSPLIYILVIAGVITLFLKEWTDAIVILVAVILNVIVGFFQENKATNILRELKKVLKSEAVVLREGGKKRVFQEELVPGDIFILKPGDKVPADGRLITSFNLKTNEAPLTGEWIAADKRTDVLPEKTPLADRDNMVYMGTVVETGSGKAIATATGLNTEIGKVAKTIKAIKEEETPYQKKLAHFSKIIGIILIFISFGIFIEGIIAERQLLEMFKVAIAVAIAAIPEGLPVAMTVILALGMQRILRKKGLIRRLSSVETLGSTSVIATDKTLTLTEGKMEVAEIVSENKDLALKIGTLCNEAFVENPGDHFKRWRVRGRPTDRALTIAGAKAGLEKPELEKELPKIDELPFDDKNKFIGSLHKGKNKNLSLRSRILNSSLCSEYENFLFISGAPEKVLALSRLKKEEYKGWERKLEKLTSQGLRVIATAHKTLSKDKSSILKEDIKDLEFVGFLALKDPLRKEAKEAILLCKKAGMRPIIVTGDHLLTAKAVAKELGFKVRDKNVILGQQLDELSEKEFEKRLEDITVYARVEPKHKMRIIRAWQERGKVVAMTGDGINDAPALKKADVGVALGSGTEVAKEASDLVLLTDNFSVIVEAVKEGRAILDNIRKVITYLISDSFTEVILVGASIMAGAPFLPVSAVQILWVNLIEDGLPGIALSFEPEEKDVMKRKPESHSLPLLTPEMKVLIFIIGIIDDLVLLSLFFWLLSRGHGLDYIRTMVFTNLTIDTFYVAFSCKSLRKNIWEVNLLSNKFLLGAVLFGVLTLMAAVYLPPFQILLKTVPLGVDDWLLVIFLGLVDLALIEATKHHFIVKRKT